MACTIAVELWLYNLSNKKHQKQKHYAHCECHTRIHDKDSKCKNDCNKYLRAHFHGILHDHKCSDRVLTDQSDDIGSIYSKIVAVRLVQKNVDQFFLCAVKVVK